jgi:hypothetical protein
LIDVTGSHFTRNGRFDPEDLDDGFDIDEYDEGGISGSVSSSSANKNYEEGFDFNENDPDAGATGDLEIEMTLVSANHNVEEGIDLEEDDDFGDGGDLIAVMNGIETIGNAGGDGGLKIREKEAGNLEVELTNVVSGRNETSGIYLRESSGGNSLVRIEATESARNANHGIELLESGGGDLTAEVEDTVSEKNTGNGVFAEGGTVTLTDVSLDHNDAGPTGGTATFLP